METSEGIQCVGFIMDGNRRWAKERGFPTLEGHLKGYEAFRTMIDAVYQKGIPHMVCYAFSTENWKRSEEEVSYLMNLMGRALQELSKQYTQDARGIHMRVIGDRARLPKELQNEIAILESEQTNTPKLTVWVAISYGGRAEIVDAVNRAVRAGREVTEENFDEFLSTHGMPDPDLVIRTSGEIRTSNFLIWQSAYSELFFTETKWPDFGESEFTSMLEQYGKRQRRKGA